MPKYYRAKSATPQNCHTNGIKLVPRRPAADAVAVVALVATLAAAVVLKANASVVVALVVAVAAAVVMKAAAVVL